MRQSVLLILFALGACATAPQAAPDGATPGATPTAPAAPAGTCRSIDMAPFVGQVQSDALDQRLRAATGAKTVRWVAKGMMVTMDFREDRLTVYLDEARRIERAACG